MSDNIFYHGKTLTIVYDRFGDKYNKGRGLMCFADGRLLAHAPAILKLGFSLK